MAIARANSLDGITALAGGGQTGAPQLREQSLNRVSTVATAADSVMLPTALHGMILWGVNAGANSMNLFPQPGETIRALSANTALAIAANKEFTAFCVADGNWRVSVTA